jgi:dTDP-6-deoxy-L-talose 4-dehydrogenase (NAD+)
MNIFLTGGTGFIGCHFINELTKNGHHVRALRRIYSQQRIPLHKSPEWIEGDLSKPNSDWFNGIDVLVHLASHTPNPPYAELAECIYWNVYAPLKVFELARSLGVTKFIAGGTMFEYGIASNAVEYLEVDTPLKPNNSYSTSKASASLAFEGFSREKNVSLKLLRFFQVYGEIPFSG